MKQRTLFDDLPDRHPLTGERYTGDQVVEGLALAELCADKAEAHGWDRAGAAAYVLAYLEAHGPTTGEDLVTAASVHYPPHDGRAFGAVFGMLSRRGIIRKAGLRKRTKGHGADGAVIWQLTPGEET